MPRSKGGYLDREGLASQLARDFSQRISREEIAPGSRLPTEAQVATQYGVSRTVVREAISRLRAEGLLTARPGAGTFVTSTGWNRPFRLDTPSDPSELQHAHVLELRMAFEVEAARLAAVRRDATDLAQMRRCLALMSEDIAGTEQGVEADVDFHRTIALATKNSLYGDFFDFINPHIRKEIRRARENTARLSHSKTAGLWLQAQSEHAAILAAIENQNPIRAATMARQHLRNTLKRRQRNESPAPGAVR